MRSQRGTKCIYAIYNPPDDVRKAKGLKRDARAAMDRKVRLIELERPFRFRDGTETPRVRVILSGPSRNPARSFICRRERLEMPESQWELFLVRQAFGLNKR